MREWLVIESTWNRSVFAGRPKKPGYIPRDSAERLLGRSLAGMIWFTKDESEQMRKHPEWRDEKPGWSPLGFWLADVSKATDG